MQGLLCDSAAAKLLTDNDDPVTIKVTTAEGSRNDYENVTRIRTSIVFVNMKVDSTETCKPPTNSPLTTSWSKWNTYAST